MRALISSLVLLAAADGAGAHALDASHSLTERLLHQFGAPHHALLLLGLGAFLFAALRYARSRRQRND